MVDGVNTVAGRYVAVELGAVDEGQRDGDGVVGLDREVADDHRPRSRFPPGRLDAGRVDARLRQRHTGRVGDRERVERSRHDPLVHEFVEVGLGLGQDEVVQSSSRVAQLVYRPVLYMHASSLPATSVVHVEHSVGRECVCVCAYV